jgi:secondary thiamine-phosphate synthase enzyme
MTKRVTISTPDRSAFIDITDHVVRLIAESGVREGSCLIYSPHTTCGVTINENADPDVKVDLLTGLDSIAPWENQYRHAEGNSAAHIKAGLMGFSTEIPVADGRLLLGTWQSIYLCEFDGPRRRTVVLQVREF